MKKSIIDVIKNFFNRLFNHEEKPKLLKSNENKPVNSSEKAEEKNVDDLIQDYNVHVFFSKETQQLINREINLEDLTEDQKDRCVYELNENIKKLELQFNNIKTAIVNIKKEYNV